MNVAVEKAKQAIGSLYKMKTLRALTDKPTKSKSLAEMLALYPSRGEGFKVWQRDWPAARFFRVSHVETRGPFVTEVWGYFHKNGLRVANAPIQIMNISERKIWNHEVGPSEVTLDNGLVYNERDFQKFKAAQFPLYKK